MQTNKKNIQSIRIAGVDVGGTKIAFVLREGQTILHQSTIPTQAHEGPNRVIERLADHVWSQCLQANLDPTVLAAVGVGLPAVIDYEDGRTLLMPNLPGGWNGLPVAALLRERLGCAVALINDARAFALAEANYGKGQGLSSVACFTVGTGIGGGLVVDGRLHLGFKGSAGEFGHQTIDPNGLLCGCGNYGCLETLVSGPAIAAAGVRTVLQGVDSAIARLVNYDIRRITPATIKDAAEAGDPIAVDILSHAGNMLGIGISNVITLFAPQCVVLGGGVIMALGDWILDPARATVRQRCKTVQLDKITVVPAALGPYSGAIGAAIWAEQQATA